MRRAAALVVALALAGCGGTAHRATSKPPRLPRDLARAWAARARSVADALAAGDGCTALQRADDLRGAVVQAVNARRIPARLEEQLTAAVNELPDRITCTPPAPPTTQTTPGHDHGKHKGRDRGNGDGGD